jgi:hypothetical protein
MLGHSHVESVFDDFARHPLLPNALSNLGPGVTWYDVDRDGDDDLLIPSGRGGQLAYYRNDGGRLRHVDLGMGESAYDQTTVLGLPSGPNSTALLLGQSSYEARTPSEALSTPGVLHLDMGVGARSAAGSVTEAVPGDTSAVGPLALADVDGDGDLDLFVGGRVIPAVYPVAATARLFRNEGGRFVRDAANAEVLSSIGLASAAVFSDVDADGDPDLILAIDWGPITLLLNDGGRFSRAGESYALASFRSRWNGISTGDFNGDGLIDIAATSWGRNTTHAVDEHPLLAYYSDFDRNGRIDVILAQFDEGLTTVAPLVRFSRLIVAMPFVRRQTPTYQDYADATLEEVVDRDLQSINWVAANTLDHMVFLNRGDAFEGIALPREAQMAPAFHVGVADFDGDGVEDLFLSQNFFATEVGTPRHDAGRALWLRGDGTGGFAPVSSQESGVIVYGDQRGAAFADFDADGRIDLAVSQNAARTKLFHNQRATPGLRVRLRGGPGNPNAVGALIRIMYPDGLGPAREVRSGSGYWSQDGAVQVLGLRGEATGVWVRWPGGAETETPVPPGAREITIPSGEL